MGFPTIFDLLDRVAFLRGTPSVVVVLVAAFAVVALWDMRLALPALLAHYLVAGLLFVDILDPRLAFVYVLTGLFVTAMSSVTAWQVNWGRPPRGLSDEEMARLGIPRGRKLGPVTITERRLLRLGLAALVLVAALWAGRSSALLESNALGVVPQELAYIAPAIIGLVGLGLVGLATTTEPLPGGMGLLLLLTGFSLFYGFLDQSLVMTIALVVAQLTVTLVAGYLAQARYLPADVLD